MVTKYQPNIIWGIYLDLIKKNLILLFKLKKNDFR
jgi:hypothetical protein